MEHRHQIEQFAPAQRVVNQVGFLAAPERHVVAPELRRNVFALEHRAVGDVARYARLAVADHRLANRAPHAVGSDQRAAGQLLAAGERHGDRIAALPERGHPGAGAQGYKGLRLAGVQKHIVQVGAVNDAVGKAVGRARVRALAQLVACEIHPVNNLRVLKYLLRELKLDEATKNTWYNHWCRDGLEAFERQLSQGPASKFCYGETPTLADCCLVPQIFNARRFDMPFDGLTRTMAVFDACMALPAFQQAQPSACPDFEP